MFHTRTPFVTVALCAFAALQPAFAADTALTAMPIASLDLMTDDGASAVGAHWRYADVHVTSVDFFAPGADGQPSNTPAQTLDIEPHAGDTNYDDSQWEHVAPRDLTIRRGNGRLSFCWYRANITIPERIGGVDLTGTTAVFETSIDDYAEVWVNGELSRFISQQGGSVIAGWNAPNRLVIARNVTPGMRIQLAIFGANGPLSSAPTNYIWMRTARLDFVRAASGPVAIEPAEVNVDVVRLNPAIETIVSKNPKVYKLAEGFQFTEGPAIGPDGNLYFSDPNANRIYRYIPSSGTLDIFRENSGYTGADVARFHQPGSNGLAFDAQGRLTTNEHGNRRITRTELDGTITVLVDRDHGKRLNSPNDLVYHSSGGLYFTDPPFGLPMFENDSAKELSYNGVYRLSIDGSLTLLVSNLAGPNGIAFSPDEKYLYVGDWDPNHKAVMRYPVKTDGTLGRGEVFCDLTAEPGEDAIDGVKVDERGNVYISGPGGLWIVAADGTRLGQIITPKHVHNMNWGGEDHKTLYLCARDVLYRMTLGKSGAGRMPTSATTMSAGAR